MKFNEITESYVLVKDDCAIAQGAHGAIHKKALEYGGAKLTIRKRNTTSDGTIFFVRRVTPKGNEISNFIVAPNENTALEYACGDFEVNPRVMRFSDYVEMRVDMRDFEAMAFEIDRLNKEMRQLR